MEEAVPTHEPEEQRALAVRARPAPPVRAPGRAAAPVRARRATATASRRPCASSTSAGSIARPCTAPSPTSRRTGSSSRGRRRRRPGTSAGSTASPPLGERVLGVWMSVIKEERDLLGRVLRRYQATGTLDAILAEVDGGWARRARLGLVAGLADLDRPAAPASRSAPSGSRHDDDETVDADDRVSDPRARSVTSDSAALPPVAGPFGRAHRGPLDGGPHQLRRHRRHWHIEACVCRRDGRHRHVALGPRRDRGRRAPVGQRPVRRRAAATHRRPPVPAGTPRPRPSASPAGRGGRYRLAGELTFHGVTRPVQGTVQRRGERRHGGSSSPASRCSTSVTSTCRRPRCSCCASTPTCGSTCTSRPTSRRSSDGGVLGARRRLCHRCEGRAARTSTRWSAR